MTWKTLAAILLSLSLAHRAAGQAPPSEHEMHALHADTARYIAALEDPERDAYQKPDQVVETLALRPGETIADIGAGSGYFALRFAGPVGPTGRVYAVDIDAGMIRHLSARVRDARLENVTVVHARPDDPLLPDAAIDRVFICDVWHHIQDQPAYLATLKRALKPGGQIVMIDFHKRDLPVGPPARMKIARETLIAQMLSNGFRVIAEHTFLPYQYFLVFGVDDQP